LHSSQNTPLSPTSKLVGYQNCELGVCIHIVSETCLTHTHTTKDVLTTKAVLDFPTLVCAQSCLVTVVLAWAPSPMLLVTFRFWVHCWL
jgi:hypothetical protein